MPPVERRSGRVSSGAGLSVLVGPELESGRASKTCQSLWIDNPSQRAHSGENAYSVPRVVTNGENPWATGLFLRRGISNVVAKLS